MSKLHLPSSLARISLALVTAFSLAGTIWPAPPPTAHALNNGLALTPPMGFNNWNAVGCGVTETFIKQTADLLVSSGLAAKGYVYVNIDDCWANSTRTNGHLVPNPSKFPSGISGTADYVHSKGLKLGLYNDSGTMTCSSNGFPGSFGFETTDANDFAAWGIDYLKDDDCKQLASEQNKDSTIARYKKQSDALLATGRPIVFSICEKGDWAGDPALWSGQYGNLWRTTHDIHAYWTNIKGIIATNIPKYAAAGPGAWNDPDMLEIGNPPPSGQAALTLTEEQTHMSMWAIMAAPLIIGTKLATATSQTMSILGNTDVIAIDQDSLGKQGVQIANNSGLRVLTKELANGDRAVALYNETDSSATISTTAAAVGMPASSSYSLFDTWTKATTTTTSSISRSVPAHGTVLLRVHAGSVTTTSYEGESGVMSGAAVAASCTACSGGSKVKFLGSVPANSVTLTVNASSAGNATLTIYGLVSGTRSFFVSVNGGADQTVSMTGVDFNNPFAASPITVALNTGSNTIKFHNDTAWAPDLDKIDLQTSGPTATATRTNTPAPTATRTNTPVPGGPTTYEAEATGNTFSGSVATNSCTGCSGGAKVRFIGNNTSNYEIINNVTVATNGTYQLTVTSVVSGTRTFFVSVNGGTDVQLTFTGSSWSVPAPNQTINVPLNAGSNTVKFHNDTAWAPDLDKIVIQ